MRKRFAVPILISAIPSSAPVAISPQPKANFQRTIAKDLTQNRNEQHGKKNSCSGVKQYAAAVDDGGGLGYAYK